jgi:hypothetical protein
VCCHIDQIMNVIYGYIPSNTTITVFQLVFISGYMFRPVYNGRLQALARGDVLHIVLLYCNYTKFYTRSRIELSIVAI